MMRSIVLVAGLTICLCWPTGCQKKSALQDASPASEAAHNMGHDEHKAHHPGDASEANHRAPAHKDSLYLIDETWKNQDDEDTTLGVHRGHPVLMAMIFTQCGHACPMMVSNMRAIEAQLPAHLKDDVRFVLITFDTEYDTPATLKQYAQHHRLGRNWTLLHGNDDQVRTLSMLLNIQYSQLDNGQFNHSNILTLLDANGAMIQQYEGLGDQGDRVLNDLRHAM